MTDDVGSIQPLGNALNKKIHLLVAKLHNTIVEFMTSENPQRDPEAVPELEIGVSALVTLLVRVARRINSEMTQERSNELARDLWSSCAREIGMEPIVKAPDADMPLPRGSEELAKQLSAYAGEEGDEATNHYAADRLLCDELKRLGYTKAVEVYEQIGKWYE